MSTSHVSAEDFQRLVTGRLEPAAFKDAFLHLLRCRWCRARLAPFSAFLLEEWPQNEAEESAAGEAAEASAYDEAAERAIRRALAAVPRRRQEVEQAPALLAAVLALPSDERGPRVRELPPSIQGGWALAEAFLAAAAEMRFRDPAKMLQLAYLAQFTAGMLKKTQEHPPALQADFEARTWGELANAYRLNDKFADAEESFAWAFTLLDQGTGDILLRGRLFDLRASLCTSQRRLPEAIELLGHAKAYYQEAGDDHLVGRALLKTGVTTFYQGDVFEAVRLLRDGLALLDPARDPKLVSMGHYDLLNALVDCSELGQAGELLLRSGLRQAFADEPLNLLRLRWIEGRIFAGRGKHRRAAEALSEVRDEFLVRGMDYDAALAGLELAGAWLRQGRKNAEVRELADEAREIFQDLGVGGEAIVAVAILQEACRRREATPGLVERIVSFLRQLEWNPQLRFAG